MFECHIWKKQTNQISSTVSPCEPWPPSDMPVYHDHSQYNTNYSPNNGYGANLSDSVPNLSLNMCALRKQSNSHGDLMDTPGQPRYMGRSESIDSAVRRTTSSAAAKSRSKPPIYEKFHRYNSHHPSNYGNSQLQQPYNMYNGIGPSMLFEDREMPITRDRNAKNAIYANGQHVAGDMGKTATSTSSTATATTMRNGSPAMLLRANGHHAKYSSDWMRIRYSITIYRSMCIWSFLIPFSVWFCLSMPYFFHDLAPLK